MKNIVIISSSPRKKGNSQILCEQFKKGAEAKGHQVKIVRIMEQNIGFCRACDGCMRNGGTCVLKDDMAEILKMFQKADGSRKNLWNALSRCICAFANANESTSFSQGYSFL